MAAKGQSSNHKDLEINMLIVFGLSFVGSKHANPHSLSSSVIPCIVGSECGSWCCLNFTMYEIARIAQVWDGTKTSVSEKGVVGDGAY